MKKPSWTSVMQNVFFSFANMLFINSLFSLLLGGNPEFTSCLGTWVLTPG